MSLIWHIFKKDLRRLWPHLLLFVAATAIAYRMSRQFPARLDEGMRFDDGFSAAWFVPCWLLWISLFPAIIQADPPVGTREFWMTRPIGVGRLFVSKLVQAVVLGVGLAAMVHGVFLLTQGFHLLQAVADVTRIALPLAVIGAMSFFLATLTGTIWSFWSWFVALWIAGNVVGQIGLIEQLMWTGERTTSMADGVRQARTFLRLIFLLLAAVMLAALQYRHRRRLISVVAGALLLGSITIGVRLCRSPLPWLSQTEVDIQRLNWEAVPLRGEYQKVPGGWATPMIPVQIKAPRGEAARFTLTDGKTEWADGTATSHERRLSRDPHVGVIAAIQDALGSDFALAHEPQNTDGRVQIRLGSGGADRVPAVSYAGHIQGRRMSFALLGKTRLVRGSRVSRDGCKLTIEEAPQFGKSWQLSIRYQVPSYPWRDLSLSDVPCLVLVNSSRKEARLLEIHGNRATQSRLVGVKTLAAAWRSDGDWRDLGSQVALDDAWLAQAELYVFVELLGAPVSLPVSFNLSTSDATQP